MDSSVWPAGSIFIGAVVLAIMYGYLYFQYRYHYLSVWSVTWGIYIIPALIGAGFFQVPTVVFYSLNLVCAVLLLRGMLVFRATYHPRDLRWLMTSSIGGLAALVWMLVMYFAGAALYWQLFLTYAYIFIGFSSIGIRLLLEFELDPNHRRTHVALGIPLTLLGLCALAVLLRLPPAVLNLVQIIVGITLPIMAVSMFIAFVDHLQRDVLDSQKRARRDIEEELRESQRNFRSVVEQQGVGVGISDAQENFLFANPAAEIIFGVPRGQLVGRNLREFMLPEQLAILEEESSIRKTGVTGSYELTIQRLNGVPGHFWINATPRYDRNGEFIGTVAVFHDITARKTAEAEVQRLLEAERFYRQQTEALQDVIREMTSTLDLDQVLDRITDDLGRVIPFDSGCLFLYDENHRLVAVAGRGYSNPEKVIGQELSDDILFVEIGRSRQAIIIQDAAQDARYQHWGDAMRVRGWMGVPLLWQSEVIGMFAIDSFTPGAYTEIHAKLAQAFANQAAIAIHNSRLFKQVEKMSVTDPLTGLFNRRHLFERAQQEFSRFTRYQTAMTIVMMDIDHFNQVNNTYGHVTGDIVLQEVARRLLTCIRQVDVLGRYGGEEFMVVLTELSEEESQFVAERMRRVIADQPVVVDNNLIRISLSVGVASSDSDCDSLDCLIIRADKALYQSKAAGRNRVSVWRAGDS